MNHVITISQIQKALFMDLVRFTLIIRSTNVTHWSKANYPISNQKLLWHIQVIHVAVINLAKVGPTRGVENIVEPRHSEARALFWYGYMQAMHI